MFKLLVEALTVGLSLAVFVWIMRCLPIKNEFVFMFLVGTLLHLTFEVLGLNKWYCKNGVACN